MTLLFCLLLGAMAGFLAGLFGTGAGVLVVPALRELFRLQGFPVEIALRLALGTSMAAIVFSSLASLRAHHRRSAVNWLVVKRISPGIMVGTLVGSQLASRLPAQAMTLFFSVFLVAIAIQLIAALRPASRRPLPDGPGMTLAGLVIGLIMSLIAGGGAVLSIPFLLWCSIEFRVAVGTAAAIGLPIALSGTLGYVVSGWEASGRPPGSAGYVYLPALIAIAAVSSFTARFGAEASHRLPVRSLRRAFAVFLLLVAARMVATTW